jgi:hypothetical protein
MNWKGFGRGCLGLIEVYRGVFLEGSLSQDTLHPVLDSNRAPYECEVGALPLGQPVRSRWPTLPDLLIVR